MPCWSIDCPVRNLAPAAGVTTEVGRRSIHVAGDLRWVPLQCRRCGCWPVTPPSSICCRGAALVISAWDSFGWRQTPSRCRGRSSANAAQRRAGYDPCRNCCPRTPPLDDEDLGRNYLWLRRAGRHAGRDGDRLSSSVERYFQSPGGIRHAETMGYSRRYLSWLVLKQALILAIAGFLPGLLLAEMLYQLTERMTHIPIEMTLARACSVLLLSVVNAAIRPGLIGQSPLSRPRRSVLKAPSNHTHVRLPTTTCCPLPAALCLLPTTPPCSPTAYHWPGGTSCISRVGC